jgi:hypothetical protein
MNSEFGVRSAEFGDFGELSRAVRNLEWEVGLTGVSFMIHYSSDEGRTPAQSRIFRDGHGQ